MQANGQAASVGLGDGGRIVVVVEVAAHLEDVSGQFNDGCNGALGPDVQAGVDVFWSVTAEMAMQAQEFAAQFGYGG